MGLGGGGLKLEGELEKLAIGFGRGGASESLLDILLPPPLRPLLTLVVAAETSRLFKVPPAPLAGWEHASGFVKTLPLLLLLLL